jgi:hypothetical protein
MYSMKHVYVATPCYGCLMSNAYVVGVLQLQTACAQRGVRCTFDFMGNESLITRARCILAGRFLTSTATHFLFIDADIGFDPNTVLRLLDADKDVSTAVYPKKYIDWNVVKQKVTDNNTTEPIHQCGVDFNINLLERHSTVDNGMVRVLDSATGFMMIRRDIVQRMCDAYRSELECVNDISGTRELVPKYVAIFDCMIDPVTKRYLSEDYAFCRRCQRLGIEIYADISTQLCHVGNTVFSGNVRDRILISGHHQ